MSDLLNLDLSIDHLLKQYRADTLTPENVIERIHEKINKTDNFNIWISILEKKRPGSNSGQAGNDGPE